MIIWWDTSKTPGGGGGEGPSVDPGIAYVLNGRGYQINGVNLVGNYAPPSGPITADFDTVTLVANILNQPDLSNAIGAKYSNQTLNAEYVNT